MSIGKQNAADTIISLVAVVVDAAAILGGLTLATWLRFDSGWIPLDDLPPSNYHTLYFKSALVATALFLLVFRSLGLFVRPQVGSFESKIPRLVRATLLGTALTAVLAFSAQNTVGTTFSRLVLGLGFVTVSFWVLLERYILYRIEWNAARHSRVKRQVLILGTDSVAAHLKRSLKREPMLRAEVIGFLRTDFSEPDLEIPPEMIRGNVGDLGEFAGHRPVDQVILTDSALGHDRIVEIILLCEKHLMVFNMVPDLFRIMTSSMDVQSLDDIPLLGISRWPLDFIWNRVLKRVEDMAGAAVGLLLTAPALAVAAALIKRSSPGPVFYRQQRCGEKGRLFTIYKLRTMPEDSEAKTGPVFAREGDPRVTRVGAFLRRHNLDELPQLWNVLKGDMSLVGPRPERPHFVEQFKEGINHYMWRHVSKPGMTGWAQVNGLRGNTSIEERIKYDLYYLENWSLAFDFKILLKTLSARQNAY